MKKHLKLTLLTSLITLSLSACNGGGKSNTQSNTSANTTLNADVIKSSQVVSLGSPFSKSNNNILLSNFPVDTLDDSTPVSIGPMKTEVVYSATDNISDVIGKIGVNASLAGATSIVNGSLAVDYLNGSTTKSHTLSYFYQFDVPMAVSLSNTKESIDFIDGSPASVYGDSFVSSLNMGLYAGLHIEISSDSESAINELQVALAGGYKNESGTTIDLKGALDMLDSNTKSNLSTTIRVIQLGGDPNELTTALNIIPDTTSQTQGQEGLLSTQCGPSDLSSCLSLVNQFELYGQTKFSDQVTKYMSSLIGKSGVTWGDIKMLFPIDTQDAFAVNGRYVDKTTGVTYSNSSIDSTITYPMVVASNDYDQLHLDELKINALKTATLNAWNGGDINNALSSILKTKSNLIAAVQGLCLSTVVTSNSAKQCKNTLNKLHTNDVAATQTQVDALFNNFKGFPINSAYVDGQLITTYLIPTGGYYIVTPIPFKLNASVYPAGIWANAGPAADNNSFYLSSPSMAASENNPIVRVVNPNLKSAFITQPNSLIATIDSSNLMRVSGTLYNESGDTLNLNWSGSTENVISTADLLK